MRKSGSVKVLVVGSNKHWAIERNYIKYLREYGAEVHLYAAADIIFNYHSKNLLNKILFKTTIKTGYEKVNADLLKQAEAFEPDIIWVFKGMEIFPSTLKRLSSEFMIVNYNPDHPFIISGRGSGNRNVTESVGLYHLHFCYNRNLQIQIKRDYNIPAVFLPFGYELSEEEYHQVVREPELNKVCFIGNPDKIREETISHIAESGFLVDVYGHGWNKTTLQNHKNVTIYDAIYGLIFWKKLRAYRVQLNIFRKHNLGSHNMRSFEIPAVGGIQLAPYSEEHVSFFEPDKEIFLYRDSKEMINLIEVLLNDTGENINRFRMAARSRSLKSDYSYKNRALTVYKAFQSLMLND